MTFYQFNSISKSWVTGCFLISFVMGLNAAAAETYVARTQRLLAEAQATHALRPDLEAELAHLANSFRVAKGLRPLTFNTTFQTAARAHAMDLMQSKTMGHVASSGQDFDSRMRALEGGAMILPAMAENAARVSKPGTVDKAMAARLFEQWVKSASHRHTLLSRDYVSVATGVVSQGGVLYADQIFIGPQVTTNMQRVAPETGQGLY